MKKLLLLLLVTLLLACNDDCTQSAIQKLPQVINKPECDQFLFQDFTITPGNAAAAGISIIEDTAIVTGNLEVNGTLDLNGYNLAVNGELYATELIVSGHLFVEWGIDAYTTRLAGGTMECWQDINTELLFGSGAIKWCSTLVIEVNNSQGVDFENICPEPFDDMARPVEVDCSKELPYAETIDGVVWIFVEP